MWEYHHYHKTYYKDKNFIALIQINIALNFLPRTIIILCWSKFLHHSSCLGFFIFQLFNNYHLFNIFF